MMAMLGTMGPLEFTNAPEMRSVGERDEVSLALDLLARTHGSLIIRSTDIWQALAPSTPGYFLTTQGPGVDPTWTPGTGAWGIVDSHTFVDEFEREYLNVAGGFEHQWVYSDIKADNPDIILWAHISQDGGATWKLGDYRFMGRIEGHTGLMFSYTTGLGIKLVRKLGNNAGQVANGVFQSVSDLSGTTNKKHFHGWDTELDDAGVFHMNRYAAIYDNDNDPINAVRIQVSAGLFSGTISLWRRKLP